MSSANYVFNAVAPNYLFTSIIIKAGWLNSLAWKWLVIIVYDIMLQVLYTCWELFVSNWTALRVSNPFKVATHKNLKAALQFLCFPYKK